MVNSKDNLTSQPSQSEEKPAEIVMHLTKPAVLKRANVSPSATVLPPALVLPPKPVLPLPKPVLPLPKQPFIRHNVTPVYRSEYDSMRDEGPQVFFKFNTFQYNERFAKTQEFNAGNLYNAEMTRLYKAFEYLEDVWY